jgi:hypothetical protein
VVFLSMNTNRWPQCSRSIISLFVPDHGRAAAIVVAQVMSRDDRTTNDIATSM